jgi:hypothetical protein
MASLTSASASKDAVDREKDDGERVVSSVDIEELLATNRGKIDELRLLVKDFLPVEHNGEWDGHFCKYDDIFYLRYVLSFGVTDRAVEALQFTFKFRAEPENQEVIRVVANNEIEEQSWATESKKWQVGGPLEECLDEESGSGFLLVIRGGMCDQNSLMENLTRDQFTTMSLYHREMAFQYCDKQTRATGRLSKQVMIFDMEGSKLADMTDRRMSAAHAEMSKISAKVYPQLQDKMCLVRAPSWMGWVMTLFKPLMPKSALEKIELFTSLEAMWNSEWAKRRLKRHMFPVFLGGTGMSEAELPDYLNGKLRVHTPMPQITINRRSKKFVSVDVPFSGPAEIEYVMSVVSKTIKYSAMFTKGQGEGLDSCRLPVEGSSKNVLMPNAIESKEILRAEDGPLRGTVKVEGPGVLRITFDNGSSMLNSKTVKYSFDVHG